MIEFCKQKIDILECLIFVMPWCLDIEEFRKIKVDVCVCVSKAEQTHILA